MKSKTAPISSFFRKRTATESSSSSASPSFAYFSTHQQQTVQALTSSTTCDGTISRIHCSPKSLCSNDDDDDDDGRLRQAMKESMKEFSSRTLANATTTKATTVAEVVLRNLSTAPVAGESEIEDVSIKEGRPVNPFAKFLCPRSTVGGNPPNSRTPPTLPVNRGSTNAPSAADATKKRFLSSNNHEDKETHSQAPPATKKRQLANKKSSDFVRMADMSQEEQESIVSKWHSLVDASAALEVRRFQVFVAALVHAQCREATVRQAMDRLRSIMKLNVESVAKSNHEDLIPALTSLQYYSVKAQHLIRASKDIRTKFHGHVPERENELRQLPGIGPVLADLLAFVNTREMHRKRSSDYSS